MDYLRKEIFQRGTYNKFKYKKIGPCKILRKISNNAYKLELPKKIVISLVFNFVDLYELHEGEETVEESTLDALNLKLPVKPNEEIEHIFVMRVSRRS